MEIAVYKNIKIHEYVKLSKSRKSKIHYKCISWEYEDSTADKYHGGCNTIFNNTYLSTDKIKLFDTTRCPNKDEMYSFVITHGKTILEFLNDKLLKSGLNDIEEYYYQLISIKN